MLVEPLPRASSPPRQRRFDVLRGMSVCRKGPVCRNRTLLTDIVLGEGLFFALVLDILLALKSVSL